MLKYAELGNTITAYEISGEGPPVLLMHGAEGSRENFTEFAAVLSQHATVINYDQRECGETKKKYDGNYTLADVAQDAADLVNYLGYKSVSVLGSSLGGRVAQTFAIHHPKLLDDLMLCNTWPVNALLFDLNPSITKLRDLSAGLPKTAREVASMYFPTTFVDVNPKIVEEIIARSNFSGRAARQALINEVADTPLSMIKARTLLIAGEEDRLVPPSVMRDMASVISECRLITMPDVAHVPSLQVPNELARIVKERIVTGQR
jgi:pimeloyl-ACP methyl ester carboxylesterase